MPDTRYIFNNTCTDILAVAVGMLRGEIEYRKGKYDDLFAHLREAQSLDDNLPYDEPWGWMQPVRHALGALLLEQGRVEEALQAYRADLGLDNTLSRASWHLDNVWSLHGYVECLKRLGRDAEAALPKPALTWQWPGLMWKSRRRVFAGWGNVAASNARKRRLRLYRSARKAQLIRPGFLFSTGWKMSSIGR
ncbi:M48 family metallopeptidase [Pseudomonas sp. ANT_H12B]|uniref:tetratricopeptide repeat protein n=1 Tax=Pseudomonas sp. ANT_H12B TaxID=2597348 RepID=UPI0021171FC3|nr:hypothetical protein [Pseudomonas sp. ANT_H12B]